MANVDVCNDLIIYNIQTANKCQIIDRISINVFLFILLVCFLLVILFFFCVSQFTLASLILERWSIIINILVGVSPPPPHSIPPDSIVSVLIDQSTGHPDQEDIYENSATLVLFSHFFSSVALPLTLRKIK